MPSDATEYLFDNAAPQSPRRMQCLASLYDSATFTHLEARGVDEGWNCLEVGGGGGSVARWLSERVGQSGHVVVTDIDSRLLASGWWPNVEIRVHDIARDPMEEGAYDLVHARLVLTHLRARAMALARIVRSLKPGGWAVLEEFEIGTLRPEPAEFRGEKPIVSYQLMHEVMARHGVDLRYGRRLPGLMRRAGLQCVGAEGRAFIHHPGSPGMRMLRANLEQLRGAIVAMGQVSEADFDTELALLDADDILVPSPVLWTVWGRRP
jgi:SAM-dependent methyltransferase